MKVKGVIEGKNLVLEGSVDKFNGSPLTLSGTIENVLDPRLDLSINCAQFNILRFFRNAVPETRLSFGGNARFDLHFTGALHNTAMDGTFESSNFVAYAVPFHRFGTTFHLRDSVLTIRGAGTEENGLRMNMAVRMDFSSKDMATAIEMDVKGNVRPFLPPWIQSRVQACTGDMTIDLSGGLWRLSGEARGQLTAVSLEHDTLHFTPEINYKDRLLHVKIASNNHFELEGEVQSPFHEGIRWTLQARSIAHPVSPLLTQRLRKEIAGLDIGMVFNGTTENWEVLTEGIDRNRAGAEKVFQAQAHYEKDSRKIKKYWRKICQSPHNHRGSMSKRRACGVDWVDGYKQVSFLPVLRA